MLKSKFSLFRTLDAAEKKDRGGVRKPNRVYVFSTGWWLIKNPGLKNRDWPTGWLSGPNTEEPAGGTGCTHDELQTIVGYRQSVRSIEVAMS